MRQILHLLLLVSAASCAQPIIKEHVKDRPAFSTEVTDPKIKAISNEFFALSKQNGLNFNSQVSIGFSTIDKSRVIGICTYGSTFREIDLDQGYWDRSTWISKVALLYHEMTHCYCGRDHDFDNGTMYPDNLIKSILDRYSGRVSDSPMKLQGYLDDYCPKSVMHPIIMSDQCFETHYSYYVKEMFARCKPF